MKKSLNEWCLEYFNNNLFDYCMEYAKDSPAPPVDFLFKMCEMLDGYSLYVRSKQDEDWYFC